MSGEPRHIMSFRIVLVPNQVDCIITNCFREGQLAAALTLGPDTMEYNVENTRGNDGSNWGLKGTGVGQGEQKNQMGSFNLDGPSAEGAMSRAQLSEEALERRTW